MSVMDKRMVGHRRSKCRT